MQVEKMPVDTRRLQGPEDAIPYHILQKTAVDSSKKNPLDVVDTAGVRRDQRKANEARKLFMQTGIVSQAVGSAYLEQGHTKVVCAVYGPREVQKKSDFSLNGQLFCEFKLAPFSCRGRRRGHQQDSEEVESSRVLKQALEAAVCLHQFPKAQVEVYVLVLENDGSALAASLTCAGLALADASIPMYDLVIGASLRQCGDLLLLDPTEKEEWRPAAVPGPAPTEEEEEKMEEEGGSQQGGQQGNLMIGYLPSLQQVCAFSHEGRCDGAEPLNKATKTLVDYCAGVNSMARRCLKQAVTKHMTDKADEAGQADDAQPPGQQPQ